MSVEVKYKTVLSTLKKGEKPCYRAVAISNDQIDFDQLCRLAGQRCGLAPEMLKYAGQLLFNQMAACAKDGINVNIENFLYMALSIRGTFDSANAPFVKGVNALRVNINPKGALATACDELVGVNVTEGNRCRITSVMDSVGRTEGIISGSEDVVVYAAGGTFLVDTTAEDEGVWLENGAGVVVAFGTVTDSTATTLDATFATLPEPGEYFFVVATRGGLGKEYGVSIARRRITIPAE